MSYDLTRKRLPPVIRAAPRSELTDRPVDLSGPADHQGSTPPALREIVRRAKAAAWSGDNVEPYFHRDLQLATGRGFDLVFFKGEYLGEVVLDQVARDACMPHGFLRVYQEFHPDRLIYYISDPRRFSPDTGNGWLRFPSRDTAVVAMLEALIDEGCLGREERLRPEERRVLERLSFASTSFASPACRVQFRNRDLGRLTSDASRSFEQGRWSFVGPPCLGRHRISAFHRSRDEAALALVRALQSMSSRCSDRPGRPGLGLLCSNQAALELLAALDAEGTRLTRPPGERKTVA